jgi:hypothetical protein
VVDADDTVVTDVSVRSERVAVGEPTVVVVTVRNPTSTVDDHTVELELFEQIVNSREVRVPPRGEVQVEFTHNIVAPGTYTARAGSETATVTVVEADRGSDTPTTPTTSTTFPGFGLFVAFLSVLAGGLVLARRRA